MEINMEERLFEALQQANWSINAALSYLEAQRPTRPKNVVAGHSAVMEKLQKSLGQNELLIHIVQEQKYKERQELKQQDEAFHALTKYQAKGVE